MKYKGQPVDRLRHAPFVREREYTYQQLSLLALKMDLKLVRPNGRDTRIRGSRRLWVVDPAAPRSPLWAFAAVEDDNSPASEYPVPVGFV